MKCEETSQTAMFGKRILLKWSLEEHGGKVWTGFIRFKIGTGGGPL
jgi:hypothetical protein